MVERRGTAVILRDAGRLPGGRGFEPCCCCLTGRGKGQGLTGIRRVGGIFLQHINSIVPDALPGLRKEVRQKGHILGVALAHAVIADRDTTALERGIKIITEMVGDDHIDQFVEGFEEGFQSEVPPMPLGLNPS